MIDQLIEATPNSLMSPSTNTEIEPISTPNLDYQQSSSTMLEKDADVSFEEQEVNRLLAVSGSLLVTTVAGLWFPIMNILSIPAVIYLFAPFYVRSYRMFVEEKQIGMAALDLVWATSIMLMQQYVALSVYFTFIYFSEKLMLKTQDRSMNSLVNIFGEQPREVWVLVDGVEVKVPFESVQAGDMVVMQAGQTIAVDGIIMHGYATIDQRTLTGESQPIEKGIGEQVFASTVILSGQIQIQVEKAGSDTVAAQIGDVLTNTANYQTGMRTVGIRIIERGALPTMALGALAWITMGGEAATAALNASFGHSLRTAGPIAMLNFLRISSQERILVKDGRSLELLGKVDTVVFDKTGTLTEEVPTVGQIHTAGMDENELLRFVAAAEYKQTHPIAKAIMIEAAHRELSLPDINNVRVEVGYGLTVQVEGHVVQVGSTRFLEMSSIIIPARIHQIKESIYEDGYSMIYVAINGQFAGAIELRPTIRPEAQTLIHTLKKRNLSTVIISGDNEKPTQQLAAILGIDRYFAETLPEDKANIIAQLQEKGHTVCFIGDGI
ncbi:MAG: HAD-IC family P-type ATPase, partial [Chloroflexota bacterium]